MKPIRTFFWYLVATVFIIPTLSSCHSTGSPFLGNTFHAAPTIALATGEPQEGIWETFDIIVDYRYQADTTLQISGSAVLNQHYRSLYERLRKLDLYLFLLDNDNRVLDSRRIGRVLATDTRATVTFTETVAIPAEATQFVFGYEGRVVAGDPEPMGGADWFYKLPLR